MAYLTNTSRPALMTSAMTSRHVPSPLDAATLTGTKQPAFWIMAGTDATTAVDAAGYITDAKDLGMQVGDVLWYVKTDASPITVQIMIVSAINATTGAADLSDGTAITATNTD